MRRAFSVARAITDDFETNDTGRLVEGWLMCVNEIDDLNNPSDDESERIVTVDEKTITFNTGFVDSAGKEIFTGDYIGIHTEFGREIFRVVFDDNLGAFFIVENSTRRLYEPEKKRIVVERRALRLTRDMALKHRVVGNIYEKHLKKEEKNG